MPDNNGSVLDDNIFFLAGALSRNLSSEADKLFARSGLSASHALILLIVEQNPDIQPSVLSEKLYLKPSTISRLVQKLEQRELVTKSKDGRKYLIACTTNGINIAKSFSKQWDQLLQEKSELLGDRYMEVLSEMISNALDKMDE